MKEFLKIFGRFIAMHPPSIAILGGFFWILIGFLFHDLWMINGGIIIEVTGWLLLFGWIVAEIKYKYELEKEN